MWLKNPFLGGTSEAQSDEFEPHIGSAVRLEPALDPVAPSLSPPTPLVCSLSKLNKRLGKKKKNLSLTRFLWFSRVFTDHNVKMCTLKLVFTFSWYFPIFSLWENSLLLSGIEQVFSSLLIKHSTPSVGFELNNPEIKSPTFYWLSLPGTREFIVF